MKAQEYLNQARKIDLRIASKTAQIENLLSVALKCTTTYSDMPKSHDDFNNPRENAIILICDLKSEIQEDVKRLVALKREIAAVILAVPDETQRTVLERRYLCYQKFEVIADEMNYSIENIFRLHRIALKNVEIPEQYIKIQY